MRAVKRFVNHILRIVEKMPGVNLNQVLEVQGRKFVLVPKCGSRSIRDRWLRENAAAKKGAEWGAISYATKQGLLNQAEGHQVLVTVRSPIERLHSCWKQKVTAERDKGIFLFWMYYPLLRPEMSFESFLRNISFIPAALSEKHFRPLSASIDLTDNRIKFISIEKLTETLGGQDAVYISNKTENLVISDEAKKIFNDRLKPRFSADISVYLGARCNV